MVDVIVFTLIKQISKLDIKMKKYISETYKSDLVTYDLENNYI